MTTAHRVETITLRDGSSAELRRIRAHDAAALRRFHRGLSPETVRRRFFSVHPVLSPREVERFTHVDHDRREALVVTSDDQIVAVGRYDRIDDGPDAEVAFVVADAWQGRGIGTILLARLAEAASAHGITRLVADTFGDNTRMIAVLRHSGHPSRLGIDHGFATVEIDLAEALDDR